jgi:hypothetical protein
MKVGDMISLSTKHRLGESCIGVLLEVVPLEFYPGESTYFVLKDDGVVGVFHTTIWPQVEVISEAR